MDTWNSTTGGGTTNWNTTTNWNPNTIPGISNTNDAYFGDPTGLNTTVNVSSSVNINQLRFSATTATGYDITASVGQIITLNASGTGSTAAINSLNTAGNNTVDANLFLGATAGSLQAFNQSTGGTLTVNGVISGNTGNGLLLQTANFILTGNNTFTGNTQVSGGSAVVNVTKIGNSGAAGNIGAGTAIEFINGGMRYTGSGETTTKGINFVRPTAAGGGTIDASGSGALNISGAVTGTGGNFLQTLTLAGDSTAIQNAISGNISDGNGTVAVNLVSGHWALSGANNTYTGGGTVAVGATLDINSATALGTGAWNFKSGTTIDNTSAGSLTLTTNNAQTWTSTALNFTGTHDLNMGSGAVTITGSLLVVTVSANTLTVGGAIGDAGAGKGLTKSGAGTLILNGANTYTGLTNVAQGTLVLAGNNSLASGGVTLNGGVLNVNNVNALGTGTLTLTSGTIDNTTAGTLSNAQSNTITNNGDFSFGGTKDLNLGNGSATLGIAAGGTRVITLGGTQRTLTFNGTVTAQSNAGGNGNLNIDGVGNTLAFGSLVTNTNTSLRTFTIAGSGNLVVNGGISGGNVADALNYSGTGTLTVNGITTYTGNTSITSGRLLVNGNMSSSSNLIISSGATLGGNGTVAAVKTSDTTSVIAPGNSAGTIHLASLNADSGAKFQFELGPTSGSPTSDQIAIVGVFSDSASGTGNIVLEFTGTGPSPSQGPTAFTPYTIVTFGALTSNITATDFSVGFAPGLTLDTSFHSTGIFVDTINNNVQVQFSAVPEPTSLSLVGLSAAGLLGRRRRRSRLVR